VVHKASLRL